MFLVWRENTDPSDWTLAEALNYLPLCQFGLNITHCVSVPKQIPSLEVAIQTPSEPSDFFFAGLVPIISTELKSILQRFEVKAEYLPVKMYHFDTKYTTRQFFHFNLLNVVDCFDYAKSKFTQTPRGIHEIERLVLDDSAALGHHFFRVGPLPSSDPNPKAVRDVIDCASHELATAVMVAGMTGIVFTELKDRQMYPPPAW